MMRVLGWRVSEKIGTDIGDVVIDTAMPVFLGGRKYHITPSNDLFSIERSLVRSCTRLYLVYESVNTDVAVLYLCSLEC